MLARLKHKALAWMQKALTPVAERGWFTVFESYNGAFQQHVQINPEIALAHPTVYACITQIAGDIGKLRLRLTEFKEGIWEEIIPYSPFFKKPNHYQTRQKFIEQWIISKLVHGNTYILKKRNDKKQVEALYILDPLKVKVLVADNGMVFYQLGADNLSKLGMDIPAAPAYEIIHDTMECLFHPLVGVPPLFAGGQSAQMGLNIQKNSTSFFGNRSQPGGILTAPGNISDDTAKRLKDHWETNFTGEKAGKIAVLGNDLKYVPLSATAVDSQLIQQLKWSDEKICSVYKVPPYKVYVGQMPTYSNTEVIDRIYYAGCLQRYIEAIEQLLDEGLELASNLGTEFDLDDLMRMDTASQMKMVSDGVGAGVMAPNEGRRKFNMKPVKGGNTPYLQQQNYSLEALDERDKTNPLGQPKPNGGTPPEVPEEDQTDKALHLLFRKGMEAEINA